jgi:hypothetical protein
MYAWTNIHGQQRATRKFSVSAINESAIAAFPDSFLILVISDR